MGGGNQNALTHLINAGEWLIGPVDRILADAAHQLLPGVDVEDTVHVIARQQGSRLLCAKPAPGGQRVYDHGSLRKRHRTVRAP